MQPTKRSLLTPRRVLSLALGLILGPALAAPAFGLDPRPVVQVKVGVDEPKYRTHFGTGLATLEADLAGRIATQFGQEVGFLRFELEPADPDVVLSVRVGLDQPTTLRPVDLHVSIQGDAVASAIGAFVIPFRDDAAALASAGSADGFAHEVTKAIAAVDRQRWVAELFEAVVITTRAAIYQGSDGRWYWVLPFRLTEIGVLQQTEFTVEAKVTVGEIVHDQLHRSRAAGHLDAPSPDTPQALRAKALAEVQNSEALALLPNASRCEAQKVLVTRYFGTMTDLLGGDVSPTGLDLEGGP